MMVICAGVGIVTAGVAGVARAAVGSVIGGHMGSTGAEAAINKVIELYSQ
ncbi:hypothetical protein BN439_2704 [Erwinia amylovora Ea644]|nr:hypothetical protein BN439_2704 [Erwinia amylovora Ea644]CCP07802.1 hypothetical protein BN440_2789 [Erwinia amylovora MR1]